MGGGKFPTGITITPPTKTNYLCGENLNTAGIAVIATFSDKSTKDITGECTLTPTNGSALTEDNQKITAIWSWKNMISYTGETPIAVQRVLSSIVVTTKPNKVSYDKGSAFSTAGMVVTATFTSGKTAIITGYTTAPANGSILNTLGNQAVTVSYTENGVTKTSNFSISVNVKIVTWANGSDQEIADMVTAAYSGLINLSSYWAVGDERHVHLSAMAATGVGESHVAQDVTMVLMNVGGKTLSAGGVCKFIVGLKNGLANGTSGEFGYMNSGNTNTGGWNGSARRTWCNNVFYNALPATIKAIFKQHKNTTADGSGTTTAESADYFALPAEKEIFGNNTYANGSAEATLTQFEYYKIAANRIKKQGDSEAASVWWERSPYSGSSSYFCFVNSSGGANNHNASVSYLLSPFGCI